MLDEGSTPAIIKINGGKIGSCFTIQVFEDIPQIYRPEIALQPEMLKDTEWDGATKSLALIVLPTLAPLPVGKEIKSTMLNDDFVDEMEKISVKHRFWAKMMVDAFAQEDSDHDTLPIITNLNNSKAALRGHDPCCTATKGFRDASPLNSGPFVKPTCMGKRHEQEQEKVKEFFHQNPTPARPTTIKENGDNKPEVTFVCSADAAPDANGTAAAAAAAAATMPTTAARRSAIGLPGKEFYDQLIATM